ncbi:hypothetical protein M9H77_33226 [Catharanthus roseus]|uniref:Uncharacterized protein n=1 Tax=Catharanthus roseus TaxID=4058 RepID=A0ACB9ZJ14_CATRO|nr:hypothetical protein M9H77_33226 [Catharanthus roseus]
MGGCCCSSRKPQLHGTPVYYYCPSFPEEHESLTSNDSAAGFLVDMNLDMSTPDTYRSPPRPIPFDVVLGRRQSTDSDSVGESGNGNNFNESATIDLKERNLKGHPGIYLPSAKKIGIGLMKSSPISTSASPTAEEDAEVCPTCLEDYDIENPRIVTKCNHHFHLSCILEWMERSDTCPICDQEMVYEAL